MNCPNCGTVNDANSRFCLKCGTPLNTGSVAPQPGPAPAQVPSSYSVPPIYQPVPPPYSTPPQPHFQPPPPVYGQPQHGYPAYPTGSSYGVPSLSTLNIWGPFAGYGTRRHHVGWLLDGEGQRAAEVATHVEAKFKEREVPGTILSKETLTGRGVIVETRPYFMLRRGLATLALYITQFGRDLFISQAAYLKPPISNFRAIVAGLMLLFQAYMTVVYPTSVSDAVNGLSSSFGVFGNRTPPSTSGLLFLLCFIGPLGALNGLALVILICYSVYKWLIEKDFLAALRVPPNEFNEDDLMAMEKAVEQTVRQALTELKLDPDALKMTSVGQGGQLF